MDHEVVGLVKKCERNHYKGAIGGFVAWFWTINEQIDQNPQEGTPSLLKTRKCNNHPINEAYRGTLTP